MLFRSENLPADLRMDEYSSDEGDNPAASGAAIGRMLVEDNGGLEAKEAESQKATRDLDVDDDNTSDEDDLADVPDTREYMPVDIEGLDAIGFSQVGSNAPTFMDENSDDDDDGSDAEDILLRNTDAIVVVAKTEEVRENFRIFFFKCYFLFENPLEVLKKLYCDV